MPLRKQKVAIPFTAGIDDKTSPIVKDDSVLQVLENAKVSTRGVISKRSGSVAVVNDSGVKKMIEHNGELIYQAGDSIKAMSATTNAVRTVGSADTDFIFCETHTHLMPERLTITGTLKVADRVFILYSADGTGFYSVYSEGQKEFLLKDIALPGVSVGQAYDYQMMLIGTEVVFALAASEGADRVFILTVADAFTGSIVKSSVKMTTQGTQSNIGFGDTYFRTVRGLSNTAYIALPGDSSSSRRRVSIFLVLKNAIDAVASGGSYANLFQSITASTDEDIKNFCFFAMSFTPQGSNSTINNALFIRTDNKLFFCFGFGASSSNLTPIELYAFQGTIDFSGGATNMVAHYDSSNGIATLFSNEVILAFDVNSKTKIEYARSQFIDGNDSRQVNIDPASQPIIKNGKYYLLAHVGGSLYTLEVDKASPGDADGKNGYRIVGAVQRFTAKSYRSRKHNHVVSYFSESLAVTAKVAFHIKESTTSARQYISVLQGKPNPFISWKTFRGALYKSGSHLGVYHGDSFKEATFIAPPSVRNTKQETTGGLLTEGVYLFKFTFSYSDGRGGFVESTPTPTVTVKIASGVTNGKITLELFGVYPGRLEGFSLNAYETEKNGSVFHLRQSYQGGINKHIRNSTTDDDNLIANPILYTASGQSGNAAPLGHELLEVFSDRLAVSGGAYTDRVEFSKPQLPHFYEAAVEVAVEADRRGIKGLAAMESRLLVFKTDSVALIGGQGPNLLGQGRFPPSVELPFKQGLRDSGSLLVTDMGAFYRSIEGIYLINRGLTNTYIGSPVESNNEETIDAAISADGKSHVLFFSNDRTFVYDYVNQAWLTYTAQGAKAACNFGQALHYASATAILKSTDSAFTENGQSYNMRFVTSWLNVAGVTGFQRVWRATLQAVHRGNYSVEVKLYYDYKTTPEETLTFNADATSDEIEFLPARQRCKAMQLEFTFTGDNENAEVSAIEFIIGIKNIKHRIAAAKRGT